MAVAFLPWWESWCCYNPTIAEREELFATCCQLAGDSVIPSMYRRPRPVKHDKTPVHNLKHVVPVGFFEPFHVSKKAYAGIIPSGTSVEVLLDSGVVVLSKTTNPWTRGETLVFLHGFRGAYARHRVRAVGGWTRMTKQHFLAPNPVKPWPLDDVHTSVTPLRVHRALRADMAPLQNWVGWTAPEEQSCRQS